ncbi:MAG: hypothetical protein NC253_01585 [Ruminococcus sp.]|nr:hypothetical protein [Ruminococcus sp.]MCM1381408.1 hypothetical protein [Muribaculaceae bacterium]MCM1479297.1 hypothetical protein [Muribaculaceae bacterium]
MLDAEIENNPRLGLMPWRGLLSVVLETAEGVVYLLTFKKIRKNFKKPLDKSETAVYNINIMISI